MRVSLNWLKDYVDIPIGVDELAHQLTMLGLEIEAIERPGADIKSVVVGEIQSIEPHPDADKLVVCKTDVAAGGTLQIVCGAKNMSVGDRVPTALVGATLPGGFEITKRRMRGLESCGMMCSPKELGLGDDHAGLMILPKDTPVGEDIIPLLGLDDVVYDIEVTPNRGDWACMIGVARELALLFGGNYRLPELRLTESKTRAADLSSVTIENADLCPRYIGRVLTNVKIAPSPAWLCRRLIAAGQRPINNVVDITNYVLMETGHPLHAFDLAKLSENRIVVRNAKHGETLETLDEQVRRLDPDMLVIADASAPVAVAGVMGGAASEVGENTTNIFLESAYFDPRSIRRTARALGMQTEASARFQRGADIDMALYAANRAATLMQELAGAEIADGILDEYPNPPTPNQVKLRYERTGLLLGTEVPAQTQKRVVTGLGFDLVLEDDTSITVQPPSWRHDVSQEADLIEEVARFYGYDNIAVTVPQARRSEQDFAPGEKRLNDLRAFLVAQGLTELFSWTFSSRAEVKRAGLPDSYLDMVSLQNPLSENHEAMRSSLVPGVLAAVSRNARYGSHDIAAFELGPVYTPASDNTLPSQTAHLAIVLSGAYTPKHWSRPPHPADLYDLKGLAEAITDFLGLPLALETADISPYAPGQCAAILLSGQHLGHLGEVANATLNAYELDRPAYVLNLCLDPALEGTPSVHQYQPIAPFPPSLRDLALVVDADTPAGDLVEAAHSTGGKLLTAVDIFDVYTGKQVPDGKKSIALSLVFQAPDKTLTDKNTDKLCKKILRTLESNFGATLR